MVERPRNLEKLDFKLSPASINSYYRCPRKFQFRYIRHVRMPFVFKPALAIGLVTHNSIAEYFRRLRDGMAPDSVESFVSAKLKTAYYPNEEIRSEHFPIITGHAERAIHALPEDSKVREVEHNYQFAYSDGLLADEINIETRVDLIIEHGDQVFDHIDFKTGGQSGDLFQNFLSRVTVKANLKDVPSDKLRTVNILTRTGAYDVVPSDRDVHAATWETVKQTVRSLALDEEWRPKPEPAICRWCEFNTICESADLGSDDGL